MSWNGISKYKNEIYGFSILWIMIFHGIVILGLDYSMGLKVLQPIHEFINLGNMGCEIFLFCSGICLYFSYHRKPDLLNFISKRLTRIFLPVVIISGWYWCWMWLIKEQNVSKFFSKLSMMDFWLSGDQQIWFVAVILICYFLYPYIYVFLFESNFSKMWIRFVILLVVIGLGTLSVMNAYPDIYKRVEIGLTRIPVFVIGCYCGKYVYEKKELPKWTKIVSILIAVVAGYILYKGVFTGVWKRWFYLIGGVPATFAIVVILDKLKCNWIQKFLSFFGRISLNLYISHILVLRIYKLTPWYANCRILHYIAIMVISVLIGWLTEKLICILLKNN